MAKKTAAAVPKPGKNAELIVRQGFIIDATGKGPHAVPEVVILGNRDGFKYLSELFAHLAERTKSRKKGPDASAAVKLGRSEHPINTRLSDDIEFQFAPVNDANRAAVFKQHGVTMKSRQKGSLFERYSEVATEFDKLLRVMKRQKQ
jgi:hypothetical protein